MSRHGQSFVSLPSLMEASVLVIYTTSQSQASAGHAKSSFPAEVFEGREVRMARMGVLTQGLS